MGVGVYSVLTVRASKLRCATIGPNPLQIWIRFHETLSPILWRWGSFSLESFCLPTTLLTSSLGTAENWLGSRGLLDLIGVYSLWMFLFWLITGIITRVKNRHLEIITGWDYMRTKLILRKVRWGKTVKKW